MCRPQVMGEHMLEPPQGQLNPRNSWKHRTKLPQEYRLLAARVPRKKSELVIPTRENTSRTTSTAAPQKTTRNIGVAATNWQSRTVSVMVTVGRQGFWRAVAWFPRIRLGSNKVSARSAAFSLSSSPPPVNTNLHTTQTAKT